MKKLLSLLLVLSLLFGLAGCTDTGIISSPDGDTLIVTDVTSVIISGDRVEDPPATESGQQTEAPETEPPQTDAPEVTEEPAIAEDGWYYSAEDVALYLHTYGYLPSNYITKSEARKLGWSGGSVEQYAPGFAIGGDKFGNREGLLPKAPGRQYYECDIDTDGGRSRGAKRIVFSNDGLIYYTTDHYGSFEQLYGMEE